MDTCINYCSAASCSYLTNQLQDISSDVESFFCIDGHLYQSFPTDILPSSNMCNDCQQIYSSFKMVQKSEVAPSATAAVLSPPSSQKMNFGLRLQGMVHFQDLIRECIWYVFLYLPDCMMTLHIRWLCFTVFRFQVNACTKCV